MPVIMPATRPEFSWENLQTGDDLGYVTGRVSEDQVNAHAFAIGDDAARYLQPSVGAPFVPPTLLSNDLLKLFMLGYEPHPTIPMGLHTRSQIEYLAPVGLNENITITGTHTAKYIRRGRRLRACEAVVRRADGETAVRMVAVETVGYTAMDEEDSGQPPADWAAEWAPVTGQFSDDDEVLTPRRGRISFEQSIIFSGLPFGWAREPQAVRNGTHTDPAFAHRAGFDRPIAQGLMSASHLTVMLLDRFGDRLVHGGQLSFAFLKPVLVSSTLDCRGAVRGVENVEGTPCDSADLVALLDGVPATVGYARIPR